MINFTGYKACRPFSLLADMSSGATFYFHIDLDSTDDTEKTIFSTANFRIYTVLTTIFIEHLGSTTNGWWGVAIGTGHHQIAFSYDFSAGAPAQPLFSMDGVGTFAEITAPSGAYAIGSGAWRFGGENVDTPVNSFNGSIGEIGIKIGTKLTQAQLNSLTQTRTMRMPLQWGFTHYWAMDEIVTGSAIGGITSALVPDGDIAISWSTAGTHYNLIDADDGSSIQANKDDDNETEEYSATTATISGSIWKVRVGIKLSQESAVTMGVSIYMVSAYETYQQTNATTGIKTEVKNFFPTALNSWSQTDLDAMKLSLKSNTMSSTDEVIVYYLYATVYYSKNVLDYIGGNSIVGTDAVGADNNYLSYP
jgi:hypothetical protein